MSCAIAACGGVTPAPFEVDAGRPTGGRDGGGATPTREDDDPPPRDAGASPRDGSTSGSDAGDARAPAPPCTDAGRADVVLTARGAVETRPLVFPAAPTLPAFRAAATCPAGDVFTTDERPYVAVVVRNDTGAPVTLSAWAACDAKTDAFLAFYRGATTPTTPTARRECAVGTVVSNGYSLSVGDHTSPDAVPAGVDAGSATSYCPSLLRSRNVGLYLDACESAVVFVQSYYASNDPNHSLPTALRFRAD